MVTRTPPAWFSKALKRINRHFSVRWIPEKQLWSIDEGVRWAVYVGNHDGAPVYELRRRPVRGIYAKELGSRVLDWVRRADPRRFNSLEGVIEGLDIDKEPAAA